MWGVPHTHIRMFKPDDRVPLFFNYQNFFPNILMPLDDPDFCFINTDVLLVHLVTATPLRIHKSVKNYEKIA